MGFRSITEPRSQDHRPADVVIAVDEEHRPPGDAGSHGSGRLGVVDQTLDVDDRFDQVLRMDPDHHRSIAQPLGHAHPPLRGHLPDDVPEVTDHVVGRRIALPVCVGGEAADVEEGEGPLDPLQVPPREIIDGHVVAPSLPALAGDLAVRPIHVTTAPTAMAARAIHVLTRTPTISEAWSTRSASTQRRPSP